MKRLTALVLATALALAACGSGDGATAATVDDRSITVAEVNNLIHIEEGTVSKADFANFLGLLIEWSVVEEAVADELDIVITEDEITAEADRIFEEFAAEGQTREEFTSSRGVTEQFLRMVGHQEVLYRKVHEMFEEDGNGVPTDDEIDEQRDAQIRRMTEACVSHILLGELRGLEGDELEDAKTEALAEAEGIMGQLDDGAVFAELAREHSTDTASAANGGELGCASPSGWVQAFQDAVMVAPIGEVVDEPVLSEFGYHIILVRSRTLPDDEEVTEAIVSDSVSRAIDAWVAERMTGASISVTERFGTWDATGLRVTPPAA